MLPSGLGSLIFVVVGLREDLFIALWFPGQTWVHPSKGSAEAPDGWGLRASVEFDVDANGVEISGQHLQLHLGFTSSRWMLLLQHHEEDLQ